MPAQRPEPLLPLAADCRQRHSGQPLDRVLSDIDRDRFRTPAEAVAYGLADAVLEQRAAAAS